MEIVLLWLDELDDALSVSAAVLEQWRLGFLQIGFLAAVGLQGSAHVPALSLADDMLAGAAFACVAVWLFGSLARRVERLRPKVSLPA